MSVQNLVSAKLSADDQTAVLAALQTIRQKLPFLINLTPDDRQKLLKMGDGSRAFVEGTVQAAKANPDVLPRSFSLDEFAGDWTLREALLPIGAQINQLAELLDDTSMALGSDLMNAATTAYGYLQADDSAGNDALRAQLGARFKKSPRTATPAAATAK